MRRGARYMLFFVAAPYEQHNLLVYAAVFVPLERLWPHRPSQPTFRPEWWTDLAWFASSALLVQLTTFLVLEPAESMAFVVSTRLQTVVRGLPLLLQFALIVAIADLVQYWVHRACHRVPLLWRFHGIHHCATRMDWLAGSRLHLVDAALTRALVYLPLFLLGFDALAIGLYLLFVAMQATFVHANVRWRWFDGWIVTPRFHHWHHAEEPADKNFAVHLPLYDRVFGTFHLPPRAWPKRYGLQGGTVGPRGFWRQMLLPFVRSPFRRT
jgi:lathosterol oxidase